MRKQIKDKVVIPIKSRLIYQISYYKRHQVGNEPNEL